MLLVRPHPSKQVHEFPGSAGKRQRNCKDVHAPEQCIHEVQFREAEHLYNVECENVNILVLGRGAELLSNVVQQPWPPGEKGNAYIEPFHGMGMGASILLRGVCQYSPLTSVRASAASLGKRGGLLDSMGHQHTSECGGQLLCLLCR